MPSASYQRLLTGLHRYVPPEVRDHPGPLRTALEQTAELFTVPEGIQFQQETIAGVPAERVEPADTREDALLLYLHGGGYHMGGIETYRHFVGRVAQTTRLRTVHIDYRLAPEHPFPAALDDAVAVVQALIAEQGDARQVVVAGDSAGGGLTLATLLRLRDAGEPLPGAAVLLSPWTDLTCSGASFDANRHLDPVIRTEYAQLAVGWYAAQTSPANPLVSPLFADLAGLPPMLVQVGTAEVLLDDAIRLGKRLREAGVGVELEVWDDMVHVWQYYAQWIPEAQQALDRMAQFFRSRLVAV